jgi:hypothetical protein
MKRLWKFIRALFIRCEDTHTEREEEVIEKMQLW